MSNKYNYMNILTSLKFPKVVKKLKFCVCNFKTIVIYDKHYPVLFGFRYYDKHGTLVQHVLSVPEDSYNFIRDSELLLQDVMNQLRALCMFGGVKTVYFHDLTCDGVFLLRMLTQYSDPEFKFNLSMFNNVIYEISISYTIKVPSNKVVSSECTYNLSIRCSYQMLPFPLKELSAKLVPDLGGKGYSAFLSVDQSNYSEKYCDFVQLCNNDLSITYQCLANFQDLILKRFKLDPLKMGLTLASFAFKMYRTLYYDDQATPVHLINQTAVDDYIRSANYAGRVDVFRGYGKELHHYDINSLYPFVMQKYPMPIGKPRFKEFRLPLTNVDHMIGFVSAIVTAPKDYAPILPYRAYNKVYYPYGQFSGTYFTPELANAAKYGYKFDVYKGYFYDDVENMTGFIFSDFVKQLYDERIQAKLGIGSYSVADDAMDFILKMILNAVSGKFGARYDSTMSAVCTDDTYENIRGDLEPHTWTELGPDHYLVSFIDPANRDYARTINVGVAAAITAYARIHMSQFIQKYKDILFYTDTDSLFLQDQLPNHLVHPTELGAFKYEGKVKEGLFLNPKTYFVTYDGGDTTVKAAGITKGTLSPDIFKASLFGQNPDVSFDNVRFSTVDMKTLNLAHTVKPYTLNTNLTKRIKILHDKGFDTKPFYVRPLW